MVMSCNPRWLRVPLNSIPTAFTLVLYGEVGIRSIELRITSMLTFLRLVSSNKVVSLSIVRICVN